MSETRWHALRAEEVLERLESSPAGLTPAAVTGRRSRFGSNALREPPRTRWPVVLGRQFTSPLVLVLLGATVFSVAIGEIVDGLVIGVILVLNALLGFVQEWRAEKALEALKKMLSPRCRVRREGIDHDIDATELVPGDVVELDEGDRVPADLRVLRSVRMRLDESSLTGESESVAKTPEAIPVESVLAERSNLLFLGTTVVHGAGEGVVVETGMRTEFGRIADLTTSVESDETPLQRRLGVLGRQLGVASLIIAALVVLLGVATGGEWTEMVMTGVALAVAVIPEGLPAAVTITLALGVRAMLRRRALVRTLQASEALGSASVICTDKTGTLTQNQMTLQEVWLPDGSVQVSGIGYEPQGEWRQGDEVFDAKSRADLIRLLRAGLENNHARLEQVDGAWTALGEPTEAALVVAAAKAGVERGLEQVGEIPFDSQRRRMTTIVSEDGAWTAFMKGAPEDVLERSVALAGKGRFDAEMREQVRDIVEALAAKGLRVLAIAERRLDSPDAVESVETDMTFLGVVGIIDPPREGVAEAIATAKRAGIRTLMITGDAPGTARAIGRRVGLDTSRVVTGRELDEWPEPALVEALRKPVLFARTTPQQKLRIVSALQAGGDVVAMTGDGVNDAPALERADIGVAMGQRGTEVARRAADLVLTDDNYASIVSAVEEGRRQYDNIQKFVRFLLSSNAGEVLAIGTNIIMAAPLLMLPAQILWTNLLTDGVTALALGAEPGEPDAMRRPPRPKRQAILDARSLRWILALGAYQGAVAVFLFHESLARGQTLDHARTMAFTGLVLVEKINVFNFRSQSSPLSRVGWFTNRWLLLAWVSMLGLQIAVVYVPFLQTALKTVPLTLGDWGRVLLASIWVFVLPELYKIFRARRSAHDSATGSARGSARGSAQ